MPLSLEQYIETYLPTRGLPWPIGPKVEPVKARPSIVPMPVKAVFWTVYGTLLAIPQGEIQYEHQQSFVTENALEKTIKEFNMWNSMSRKPGAPSEYMRELFNKALTNLRMAGSGTEKFPEIACERIWDDIVKKLQQKEYKFDATMFGPLPEYVKKIAYFYHASIQGTDAYRGAAETLRELSTVGVVNGLLADGQCFTPGQLQKALHTHDPSLDFAATVPVPFRVISVDVKARKPSETIFKVALAAAASRGWKPHEILHIGSNLQRDIGPAKKLGFRTALFAGDKASLVATADDLKLPAYRPDLLVTELPQLLEAIGR